MEPVERRGVAREGVEEEEEEDDFIGVVLRVEEPNARLGFVDLPREGVDGVAAAACIAAAACEFMPASFPPMTVRVLSGVPSVVPPPAMIEAPTPVKRERPAGEPEGAGRLMLHE